MFINATEICSKFSCLHFKFSSRVHLNKERKSSRAGGNSCTSQHNPRGEGSPAEPRPGHTPQIATCGTTKYNTGLQKNTRGLSRRGPEHRTSPPRHATTQPSLFNYSTANVESNYFRAATNTC